MKPLAEAIRTGVIILLWVLIQLETWQEAKAADAVPASHVGTWKRAEVIDSTGKSERAGRRYFMIIREDGEMIWTGTKGAPNHPPMKVSIRNGSEIFRKTGSEEKSIGQAIVEGNRMRLLFRPVPIHADSMYVRYSKSVDPKDVAGVTP